MSPYFAAASLPPSIRAVGDSSAVWSVSALGSNQAPVAVCKGSGKSLAFGVTIGQRHLDLSDSDQRAKCSRVDSRQRRPSLLAAKHLRSRSSHIVGIDGY